MARHAIVIAPDATASAAERFAADGLALFLEEIVGAAFAVVREGEHAGPGIHVGHTRKAVEAGIDPQSLGEEDWVLLSVGEDLVLTGGRPRGTLYAVYEFLDAMAGCRWIAPDIQIVPPNPDLAVPALAVRGPPAFSWRETSLYPRHDDPGRLSKEDYARFLVRNRYNGSGYWLDEPRFGFSVRFGRPGSSHTFHAYQETWRDVKPEFFALPADGTRAPRPDGPLGHDFCLTNAELGERVADQLRHSIEEDRAEAARRGVPPPRLYAFSQNDTSSRFCRCPECSAVAQREGILRRHDARVRQRRRGADRGTVSRRAAADRGVSVHEAGTAHRPSPGERGRPAGAPRSGVSRRRDRRRAAAPRRADEPRRPRGHERLGGGRSGPAALRLGLRTVPCPLPLPLRRHDQDPPHSLALEPAGHRTGVHRADRDRSRVSSHARLAVLSEVGASGAG